MEPELIEEYAKLLEDKGVDGLELNFYSVPRNPDVSGDDIINDQIEILKKVKSSISIPVSVKLSPFYANPLNVISRMDKAGADAIVMFNRLFQNEIDLNRVLICMQVPRTGLPREWLLQ